MALAWASGAAAAMASVLLAVPSAALAEEATTAAKEPAVISMGDSFISGEAGRWQGNGNSMRGSRYGTDLAAYDCNSWETWCHYDPTRVYGSSYANGCNRSTGAEIHHLSAVENNGRTDIDERNRINIACSGATTDNILHTPFKGERPQIEQLADLAGTKDVKLIVLSIGGNDIGFSDVIADCAKGFSLPRLAGWHCSKKLGPQMPGRIDAMRTKVGDVLSAIRDTMTGAGYQVSDYRLVLQSYPSPIPSGAENRYPESSYERLNTGGCPFYDDDSDWARDTLIPMLSDSHRAAAEKAGDVDFLDLQGAFDGHEVCAKGVQQSASGNTLADPLPKAESEWGRFIVSGLSQGQLQESMHPNFYGQQEMGECLNTIATTPADALVCNNPG